MGYCNCPRSLTVCFIRLITRWHAIQMSITDKFLVNAYKHLVCTYKIIRIFVYTFHRLLADEFALSQTFICNEKDMHSGLEVITEIQKWFLWCLFLKKKVKKRNFPYFVANEKKGLFWQEAAHSVDITTIDWESVIQSCIKKNCLYT